MKTLWVKELDKLKLKIWFSHSRIQTWESHGALQVSVSSSVN